MRDVLEALGRPELNDALEDSAMRLAGDDEIDLTLLAVRDRAEHELLDAAHRLGRTPEAIAYAMPGRAVWDDLVRPVLWKLVAHNEARHAALAALDPRLHARFWWWNAGAGLPPTAVAALGAAAALVARFPEARARFESLVRAEATWTSGAPRSHVRTLRAWLSRAEAAQVSLAAAPNDERLVLETPELEVSFVAPSRLVVDLLADRRPGSVPVLRGGSQSVVGVAVMGAEERFAFDLPEALLDDPHADVTLSVPLASGDRLVVLA